MLKYNLYSLSRLCFAENICSSLLPDTLVFTLQIQCGHMIFDYLKMWSERSSDSKTVFLWTDFVFVMLTTEMDFNTRCNQGHCCILGC